MTGYKEPPRRARAEVRLKRANAYILVSRKFRQQRCAGFSDLGLS